MLKVPESLEKWDPALLYNKLSFASVYIYYLNP